MARIYYICQILASLYLTLFGVVYAMRSVIDRRDALVVSAFAAVGYIGWQLLKLSVREYRDSCP